MLASLRSAAVLGIDAYDVTVEVDAAQGLPQFTIVGLPAGSVKESRERVGAALVNAGFALPPRRHTINLAPADIPKTGTAFDLPIALGILAATHQLDLRSLGDAVVVGELGLDGALRPIRGALSIARRAATQHRAVVLPPANLGEASLVRDLPIIAPTTLGELVAMIRAGVLERAAPMRADTRALAHAYDLSEVVGQESARRALEIAAAGGHGLLLIGPPGAGKTMLARRLPTILPPLSDTEALEVIAIHSVAGLLHRDTLSHVDRPFRAPHHTVSGAGLIGGGSVPRPGEVSLAHHGVLFLDEMLEFPRHVLDALRQPLEEGRVTLARAQATVSFPARFTLVGAMNPCPCGRAGDRTGICTCSEDAITRYRGRLSGPLSDRIDLHVTVGAVQLRSLNDDRARESSDVVRTRVERARARQHARYAGSRERVACNAHASARALDQHGHITRAARELLATAAERVGLSARGYHRVLKVARTIADLAGEEQVAEPHVGEALRYRLDTARAPV